MDIHTRITAKSATHHNHHRECNKDHSLLTITFTTTTESAGHCETEAENCLLFEMEDAVQEALVEAWESSDGVEFWSCDTDAAREEAVRLAARADRMDHGDVSSRMSIIKGTS